MINIINQLTHQYWRLFGLIINDWTAYITDIKMVADAQFQERKCHEFVVPMGENQEPVTEIELDRFVSFVENPVKFFFEKQLGVYLEMKTIALKKVKTSR